MSAPLPCWSNTTTTRKRQTITCTIVSRVSIKLFIVNNPPE
jgi:hypothetical protein